MGKIDRVFISIIVFSLAISAGMLIQANELVSQEQQAKAQIQTQVSGQSNKDVPLVEARYLAENTDARGHSNGQSKSDRNLYPTTLWLLGSALLAMIGYKRMRNTITGTD